MSMLAATHLHANQHHVTQLLRCIDTGTFTVRRVRFHRVNTMKVQKHFVAAAGSRRLQAVWTTDSGPLLPAGRRSSMACRRLSSLCVVSDVTRLTTILLRPSWTNLLPSRLPQVTTQTTRSFAPHTACKRGMPQPFTFSVRLSVCLTRDVC